MLLEKQRSLTPSVVSRAPLAESAIAEGGEPSGWNVGGRETRFAVGDAEAGGTPDDPGSDSTCGNARFETGELRVPPRRLTAGAAP
nr:MAG: hypothetical protein DIU78_06025 [Pseudomonadota bacterium]